jgi:hypothetical protein
LRWRCCSWRGPISSGACCRICLCASRGGSAATTTGSFSFLTLTALCGILLWLGDTLTVLAASSFCRLISFWRF